MDHLIQIKCFDSCVYTLYPQFFKDAPLENLRKIFKFLFQFRWKDGNPEAINDLDVLLPQFCEEAKVKWSDASKAFRDGFKSTDRAALPSNLYYRKEIQAEVKKRKLHNDKLMAAVKSAKAKHEKAVKVWESYTNAKTKYQ